LILCLNEITYLFVLYNYNYDGHTYYSKHDAIVT